MELPVRYDIDDVVYVVSNINSILFTEKKPYTIEGIRISITTYDYKVFYTVRNNDTVFDVAEDYLFSTYYEAQKFCVDSNK